MSNLCMNLKKIQPKKNQRKIEKKKKSIVIMEKTQKKHWSHGNMCVSEKIVEIQPKIATLVEFS